MAFSYKITPRRNRALPESKRVLVRLFLTILGILALLFLFYFWFFIATANINNFWGLFRRGEESTTSGLLSSAPATPTLTDIPEATNQKMISFKGYADPGSSAMLYVNEVLKTQTVVDKDGNFTFNDIALVTNSAVVYVKTKNDKNQESGPSKAYTVLFDDKSPQLEVKNPQDGAKFIDPSPFYTVEGTANEVVTVYVNDHQATVDSDHNFRVVISLKEGDNFLKIKAADKAGNISEVDRKLVYEKP
jgi:hypothetical protein